MEGILAVIAIYGGIAFIGWFFGEIGKWNEERKSRIRDEVAEEILPKTNINEDTIKEYKTKLEQIGLKKNQEYSWFYKYYLTDGRKSYMGLVGKCPACSDGDLRVVKGAYGKFVGCSSYPKCRYTKNFDVAMKEYKEKSNKEFMELFHLAYS